MDARGELAVTWSYPIDGIKHKVLIGSLIVLLKRTSGKHNMRLPVRIATILACLVTVSLSEEIIDPGTQDPCQDYVELSESVRDYEAATTGANVFCDKNHIIYGNYYRFTGGGNGMLRDEVVPTDKCGGKLPMYMMSKHRRVPVESAQVCLGHINDTTKCDSVFTIEVRLCPITTQHTAEYYVYKLQPPRICDAVYCADFDHVSPPSAPPSSSPGPTVTPPVEVGSVTVTCDNQNFTVLLDKDKFEEEFPMVDPQHLTLGVDRCTVAPSGETQAGFHMWRFPLDECDVHKEIQGDYVYYSNILIDQFTEGDIIRDIDWTMNVTCKVSRDVSSKTNYVAEDQHIRGETIVGEGNFTLALKFYEDEQFTTPIPSGPTVLKLGQKVFTEISIDVRDKNIKLVLKDTKATPDTLATFAKQHALIEDKCTTDYTVDFYYTGPKLIRFSFKVFRFLKEHPEVYLHSYVYVCGLNDTSQACSRTCVPRHRRSLLSEELKTHRIYNGPLSLEGYGPKEVIGQATSNPGSWVWGLMAVGVIVSVAMVYLGRSMKQRQSRHDDEHGRYAKLANDA